MEHSTSLAGIDSQLDEMKRVFRLQQVHSKIIRLESSTERMAKLKRLKAWIESNRSDIQDAIFRDFNKPKEEVDLTEIFALLTEINHTLKHLKDWMKPQSVRTPLTLLGTKSHIQLEAKGVCLLIAPWNYPFQLAIGPLISALAAGNTAIIKPSEMTPNTSDLIQKMISELFDEQEVAVFQGDAKVSQHLLELPFDHIFFTGSPAIGKVVMTAAAKNLSSVTLELGGKSPTIVDDSSDLADAAEKIVYGKFLNNGQTCIAPDYLLVHARVEHGLIEEIKKQIKRMFNENGQGIEHSTAYARIVNERHFLRLLSLLDDAMEKGAKLVTGGNHKLLDRYFEPTVISQTPGNARVLDEEIFGPILPIVVYEDVQEAIDFINAKPKPLALYIFSKSEFNKSLILKNTSAGGVCINDCLVHFMNLDLPFGGVNNSGIGKSHGFYGFKEFSNEKSVLSQRIGKTSLKSLYPPYTAFSRKAIDLLLKFF
jgi:aldehyde dehydrogenase (NAD+)